MILPEEFKFVNIDIDNFYKILIKSKKKRS